MWSVVVVSAASVATDDYKPQADFVFSSTCLCSLMGVSRDHRIPNSASHHFSKIHFFEKQTKKKDYCLDMFFISQNLYCFKNSWAIIPMTCFFVLFFLCRICWSRNCKEGFQQFDSVFYLLKWMTEVRRVFCVRASVWTEWLTWRVVLPIDLTQCYRSGKAVSLVKQSLPVMKLKTLFLYSGLMWCNSLFPLV